MKKILATVLCAVVAMGCFMINSSKNEPMSELMKVNVDALAENIEFDSLCLAEQVTICYKFTDDKGERWVIFGTKYF